MEWFRIGLGAILMTVISVAALNFFVFRSKKRRKTANPNHIEDERKRAQNIVIGIGTATVHLVQIAGGLVAIVPMIALLFLIGSETSLPKFKDIAFLAASFFGGWMVFAWCIRITDALSEKK